jgi:hypothetical protein
VLGQYFSVKLFVVKALVMPNSNLLEFLRYIQPFLRYCKICKIIFNSVHNSAQQNSIKNVPDEIDELCFFLQIAEIHRYLVEKY